MPYVHGTLRKQLNRNIKHILFSPTNCIYVFYIIKAGQLLPQTDLGSWFLERRSNVLCDVETTFADVPLTDP
jgi:hypothetical protein